MKRTPLSYLSIILLLLAAAGVADAQLRLPRPSPKASVTQTIGVTDVTITYSRPAVKGRKIWGDPPADVYAKGEATLDDQNKRPEGMVIVPNGHIWRTGANEATQFTVTDDVLINGQKLPAGSYSLHTIPGKDEWTIIFNSVANQPGSFSYNAANDALRVKTKPHMVADNTEWLSFTIDPMSENTAQVNIRWEKMHVPFTVEVKDLPAVTVAKARSVVAAAKPDDWQTPYSAANYAKNNNAAEDAAKWYEQALKAIDMQLKVKEDYGNMSRKAYTLFNSGKTAEGITVGEKAVELGKAEKADTAALEKMIADAKAKS